MNTLAFTLFFASLIFLGSAGSEEDPLPRRLVRALQSTPGCNIASTYSPVRLMPTCPILPLGENPSVNGAWKVTEILGLCGNKYCSLPMQFCSAVAQEGQKVSLECASLNDKCQAVITNELSGGEAQIFGNKKHQILGSLPFLEKSCMDSNQFCCFWAFFGECEKNSAFMKTRCQKSCGTCSCKESDKNLCATNVNVEGCKWIPKRGRQSDSPIGRSAYGGEPAPPQPSPYVSQLGSSCGSGSTGSCGYWPIAEAPTFQRGTISAVSSPYGGMPAPIAPAPQPIPSYGSVPSPPVPQVMPAPQPAPSYGSFPSPPEPAPQPISSYETQFVKPAPVPQGPYGGGQQPGPVITIPAPPTYDATNRCGPSMPCGPPPESVKPPVVTRRPPPPPPAPRPIIHDFCAGGTQGPSPGTAGDSCQPAVLKPRPVPRPTYRPATRPPPRPVPRPTPAPPSNLINCAPGGGGPCGAGQPSGFPYPQPMPQPAPGGTVNCVPDSSICGSDSYQPQPIQPQPAPAPSPYGLRKQAMKLTFHRGRLTYQKK